MNCVNTTLKFARISRKLRQIDLARDLGVSENLVSAWETNRAMPLPVMRYRVAELLGVTPGELFPMGRD